MKPAGKNLCLALLFWGLTASVPHLSAATTLLPWSFNWLYFDDGYQPAPNWSAVNFDDGDWDIGAGQFGYGDGDEATTVSYGPDDEDKFVTTYFRTYVNIDSPAQHLSITLSLLRDDGAVVYVNGVEVLRDNLPGGTITHETLALIALSNQEENAPVSFALDPALFTDGFNVIAVEMHQWHPASADLSFDLQLTGESGGGSVTRGPYLQIGTSSNLVVRWRTATPTDTRVRFGTNVANLNLSASSAPLTTEHQVTLPDLRANTKYFYEVGTTAQALAGGPSYFFTTAPLPGTPKPTRIWAIGDFGTGFQAQHDVRNAYANFTGARPTDVWLMLGDNAYFSGEDYEYQAYCFEVYPTLFRQTVVWPALGNHDAGFSQVLSDSKPYFSIFTLPTAGQAGGVPSGSEHYYSFDYANIHFVCLDSMTATYRSPTGAMAQWLANDLADTTQDWIIAYFHHPAYTKGSHDSDVDVESTQMRQNILPILEAHGVDMVLAGHSHSYERSYFLNGHYGHSTTFNSAHLINGGDGRTNGNGPYVKPPGAAGANRGLVHIVDGSSGGQGGGGGLNHPAKYFSTLTYGSLILDVTGRRLDATFLSDTGTADDTFTIIKEAPPEVKIARAGTNAVLSWPASLLDYQVEGKPTVTSLTWQPAGGTVSNFAGGKSVLLPATNSQKIFRLRSQP